jgi:hypothetical protein
LAAAVATLAGDGALRQRLGETGRLRAEQRWDRTSIIRSLERELLTLDRRSSLQEGLAAPARRQYFLDEALRGSAMLLPPL